MDKYYQLLDRDTSTITPLWKAVHIFSLIIVSISGFSSAWTFGKSMEAYGDNCVLNAHIVFINPNDNSTHKSYGLRELPRGLEGIDVALSEWGNMEKCYFCQFTPLASMLVGIIMGSFFIICSKGGAGYVTHEIYRPWRIVYPALVIAGVSTTVMLISTLQMQAGLDVFCAQFNKVFHTTGCTDDMELYTLAYHEYRRPFLNLVKSAVSLSYICLIAWVLQVTSLILRVICLVDFQMISISVSPKHDKEEVLQNVINPEDDDNLSVISEKPSPPDVSPSAGRKKFVFFGRRRKPLEARSTTSNLHSGSTDGSETVLVQKPTNGKPKYDYQRVGFILPKGTNVAPSNSLKHKAENVSLSDLNGQPTDINKDIKTTSFSARE